jgi:hypothetical protein
MKICLAAAVVLYVDRQTDMMKPQSLFRNFANAPTKTRIMIIGVPSEIRKGPLLVSKQLTRQ